MRAVLPFRASDADLVREALLDRPRAFEALVARYQRKACAVARAIGVEASSVDDVVQESFLRAFRDLPGLRRPDRFGAWFLNITRNAARSHLRKRRESSVSTIEDGVAAAPDSIEADDLGEYLRRKVGELPEEIREAIFLYYYEGKSTRAVARALEISTSTVWHRLERGRDLLRRELWRELEDGIASSLPSRAEWKGAGRLLTFLILATVPPAWPMRAAAAASTLAAPGSAAGASAAATGIGPKVTAGGIAMSAMSAKKLHVALAVSLAIVLGVAGIFLGLRGRRDRDSDPATGAVAAVERDRGKTPAREPAPADAADAPAIEPVVEDERALGAGTPSIAGTISDREGTGLTGAEVIALDLAAWEGILTGPATAVWETGEDVSDELRFLYRQFVQRAGALPRTTSGPGGDFRFDDLEGGEYRLLVRREGYLPSTDAEVHVRRDATARCDVRLVEGESISGRVVDESGSPISGAIARVVPSRLRSRSGNAARDALVEGWSEGRFLVEAPAVASAGDGSFRLASLAPALHDVVVAKEGFSSRRLFDIPAGSDDVEVTLSRGLTLRGRVVDPARDPTAGAAVALEALPAERPRPFAVARGIEPSVSFEVSTDAKPGPAVETDAAGRFEFDGLDPGAYRLSVVAAGHPPLEEEVALDEPVVDLGEVALEVSHAIRGVVLDPAGAPLADALVWIELPERDGVPWWGGRFYAPAPLAEARSGADGRFALEELPDGVFAVRVAAAAYSEKTLSNVRAGRDDLEVRLAEGRTVAGVVRDAVEGSPVAGALILLTDGLQQVHVPEKAARSGPDGSFEIRGVADRLEYRLGLQVSHPAYPGPARFREIPDPLVVELRRGESISGRVIGLDGEPVPGARVRCLVLGMQTSWLVREVMPGSGTARTDEEGIFAVSVPPSARSEYVRVEVAAAHPGRGAGRIALPDAPSGPWPEVDIVLEPLSGLHGRVVDAVGAPVPRAVVRAERLSPGKGATGEKRVGYSSGDGSYRIDGLEPGLHAIAAEAHDFARHVAEIEVGEEPTALDLTLSAGRSVAGRVFDDEGLPVAGADVLAFETVEIDGRDDYGTSSARWRRRRHASGLVAVKSDGGGGYAFRNLPEGEVTLVARAPGFEPSALAIVEAGRSPDPLVLTRLASITGVVVDAISGAPLSIFRVHLKNVAPPSGERDEETLLPREYGDPRGRFLVDGIAPGRWAVVVRAKGYADAGEWVTLAPGEAALLRLQLEPGRVLRGVVRDLETGAGIAGVVVACASRERDAWERHFAMEGRGARTPADGSFAIDGLAPGRHSVWAHHAAYAAEKEWTEVTVGDEPSFVEIGMRPAGAVEGEIANLSTRDAVWSYIVFRRIDREGDDDHRTPVTRGSDTFKATAVPLGTYEVRLVEERIAPHVDEKATSFRRDDMVEEETWLGEVEVRAGETSRFDAALPEPREE